jgi:hypothetical protein
VNQLKQFKQTGPDTWLVDAWTVYPQRKVRVELVRNGSAFSVVLVQSGIIPERQTLLTSGVNECIQTALHLTQTVVG